MSCKLADLSRVTIRMYRKGLGDAFLIGFHPTGGGTRWMLIDCGAIDSEGKVSSMKEVASDIAETTRDDKNTHGHLHCVVVSNTHLDHVSGFVESAAIFEKMTVDEVWLPATEDPDNEQARCRKRERRKRLIQLRGVARRLPDTAQDLARSLTGVLNLFGDNSDNQPDEEMSSPGEASRLPSLRAWERKGARLVYLDSRARPRQIFSDLSEVRAFVLGPRAAGGEVSGNGNLSLAESFLSAAQEPPTLSLDANKEWRELLERNLPFSPNCQITFSREEAGGKELFEFNPPIHKSYFEKHYFAETEGWRRIDYDWLGVSRGLTLSLDRSVNNESLALAIEISAGGKVLLFPGNAQLGAWKSWGSLRWTVEDNGEKRRVRACELLSRTSVYKVSHRCSQTGTLVDGGLGHMSSGSLIALLPVNREIAQKMGWDMPYAPLLQSLREKTRGRILISDPTETPLKERDRPGLLTEAGWNAFRNSVVAENPLYIEYTLSV